MWYRWVVLAAVLLAGCSAAPGGSPVTVTPAPAPTESPSPGTGTVLIDNDGPSPARVTVTLLAGEVDRVALVYLNGTTRSRTVDRRIARFELSGGVVAAVEPSGERITSTEVTVESGRQRVIALPAAEGPTTVVIEVKNGTLVERVKTATGGWTVLADALLLGCDAGTHERLKLLLTRDGLIRWSSQC